MATKSHGACQAGRAATLVLFGAVWRQPLCSCPITWSQHFLHVQASVDEAARARRETERITAARDRLNSQIEELQQKASSQSAENRQQLTDAQSKISSLNIAIEAARQQVHSAGEQRAAAEFGQQQAEQAQSQLQQALQEEQQAKQSTQYKLATATEQLARVTSDLESTEAALTQARASAGEAAAARESATAELRDAQDKISQLEDDLQCAQDDAVAAQDAQLEAERQAGAALNAQQALQLQVQGAFEALRQRDQTIAQQEAGLRQGSEHSTQLQHDLAAASDTLAHTKQKHDSTRAELVATAAALGGAQTRESDSSSRLDAMSLRLADAEGSISALRAELQMVTGQRDRSLALLRAVNVPGVVQANMDVAATVQQALNSMLGSREGEAGATQQQQPFHWQQDAHFSPRRNAGEASSGPTVDSEDEYTEGHTPPPGGDRSGVHSGADSAGAPSSAARRPHPTGQGHVELSVAGAALQGIGSRTEATASSLHLSQWK